MNFIVTLAVCFVYSLPFVIGYLIFGSVYYSVKARLVDSLVYSREFSRQDVFADDEIEIIETITNPSALPLFFVDVESYIHGSLRLEDRETTDGMQLIISRFHLPPHTKVTRRHKITCASRGYYTMTTSSVLTKGLFVEKMKHFDFKSELYVYPRLKEGIAYGEAMGRLLGDGVTSRRTVFDPFSVSGVRDYVFGDPMNSVNFKATARSFSHGMRGIKVNRYDYCTDRVFMIFLDFTQPPGTMSLTEHENRVETALSACASVICRGMKNGYKVGFAANCKMADGRQSFDFPILGGVCHMEELLRQMASIHVAEGASFASVLEAKNSTFLSGTEIYVLTSSKDEAVWDAVTKLKRNNSLTVIKI